MTSARLALPACLGLLLLACDRGAPPGDITERDSAGVRIIDHPAAALAAAPRWGLGDPTVVITAAGTGDDGFSFLAGALRTPDGRIVLADNQNDGTRFLVYGPDGAFERRLGRSGGGPGEFRNARILGLLGDTLVLYDFQGLRVTRMRADGTLIGTAELARLGMAKVGMVNGVLADGRILSTPMSFQDTTDHGDGTYRQAGGALAIDPATATLDTLQVFPGNEVAMIAMELGGMRRSMPGPLGYGKRTLYASAGGSVHVATNTTAEIASYALPWALTRLIRVAKRPPAVDQAARDAQLAEALANIDGISGVPEAFKTSMRETVRRARFADSMASYQSLLAGADGSLWAREMRSVADSTPHLLIFGPDGHLQARADLPPGARLLWTDGAQALVAMTDENELPRLELRPVERTAVP